jgi:DNA-binding CsgD family transcriptional regulator
MLYTDRLLVPGGKLFAKADPVWEWTANYLADRVPADFKQTITRVASYRAVAPASVYKEHPHPEVAGIALRKYQSQRLPRAGPDPVPYKWKGDEYIGYDWRAAQTKPSIRINYERAMRAKEKRLARYRKNRKTQARPSESTGSLHFNGWEWVCPVCGKTCRTIYFALPRINLLRDVPRLAQVIDIPKLTEGLACVGCHGIRYMSRAMSQAWNEVVSYLTHGLLYGSEVERPEWFVTERKRAYRARINAKPSRRRPEVMELLLEGLTYAQIGQRLGLSPRTINAYACRIYAQHGVHGRGELARKLGREVEVAGRASGVYNVAPP